MNTLRFFLLLASLFFFSFVFQLQHAPRTQTKDVLSGQTQSTLSVIPTKHIGQEISQYLYPKYTLVTQSDSRTALTTPDAITDVVAWYADRLGLSVSGTPSPLRDTSYLLTATKNKQKISIKIVKKKFDSVTSITVSINPS